METVVAAALIGIVGIASVQLSVNTHKSIKGAELRSQYSYLDLFLKQILSDLRYITT